MRLPFLSNFYVSPAKLGVLLILYSERYGCSSARNNKGESEKPLLHPQIAGRYKKAISKLKKALNEEQHRAAATEHLRDLVDKIVLTPKKKEDGLSIDLHGDLAGNLKLH